MNIAGEDRPTSQRSLSKLQPELQQLSDTQLDVEFNLTDGTEFYLSTCVLARLVSGLSLAKAAQCLSDFWTLNSIAPEEAAGIRLIGINSSVVTCLVPGRLQPVNIHYLLYLSSEEPSLEQAA